MHDDEARMPKYGCSFMGRGVGVTSEVFSVLLVTLGTNNECTIFNLPNQLDVGGSYYSPR